MGVYGSVLFLICAALVLLVVVLLLFYWKSVLVIEYMVDSGFVIVVKVVLFVMFVGFVCGLGE